ncbi:dethiobiotin synthase [Clostridium sp. Marseille-P2415]|uniref:dethiobiotin synthase n=1 Tax=Clostridium sp. Marseille-P2415 TaxID=1805471 RepID=UPI0009884B58|nr:dethiobiotin synthase [Clostridium sp. Marseille-P2415]
MSKGIFITATGTDVGKTYVTALLVRKLRESGMNAGYYKAALSGADSLEESDAGYVNRVASIGQNPDTLISYLYKNAYSPHLAAQVEGNPLDMDRIPADFNRVKETYDYVVMEGSGGIICPIRYDEKAHIFLEDIIKALNLDTLLIADAGLGTINAVVLTAEYMKQKGIAIRGIILNRYTGTIIENDNVKMIEEMTGIPVIALVRPGDTNLHMDEQTLKRVFEEESK